MNKQDISNECIRKELNEIRKAFLAIEKSFTKFSSDYDDLNKLGSGDLRYLRTHSDLYIGQLHNLEKELNELKLNTIRGGCSDEALHDDIFNLQMSLQDFTSRIWDNLSYKTNIALMEITLLLEQSEARLPREKIESLPKEAQVLAMFDYLHTIKRNVDILMVDKQ